MFRQLRAEAAEAIEAALDAEGYPTGDLGLEEPPEDVDAVLASSVAFRLASEAGAPPPQVAGEIAATIQDQTDDCADLTYVDRIEPAGPYVNVVPSEAYLSETIAAAASEDDYGALPDRDTTMVVEHTSANPTGPVHVGRARNPIIGDSIARLLDYAGYDVDVHYYVNDAGRQIATFTWAYETFDEDDLADAGYADPERDKPDYDLVRYYRIGNAFLDGDHPDADEAAIEAAEDEIQSIMQGLEAGDEDTYERTTEVVDTVLSGMQDSLNRLPAEFDEFVKETRFMFDGSVEALMERMQALEEAVYEEEAWQLDLSEFGIEKQFVFQRSDGTSLYATRDIAHHEWKFDTYDRAVTVLGEDHKLQAEQLQATLDLLGNDTDRLDSIHYSWVNLPGGEGMSTREGTGIDLDDLLDEAVERARKEYESRAAERLRDDDLTEADVDRIARQVGIGAVRYDIVSKQPTKTITFDWERALDFEAQSAPYLQYAHARCCGILDEARSAGVDIPDGSAVDAAVLEEPAARDLLLTIARLPSVVEAAADDLEPHVVATYVRQLADRFNAFYRSCPVLDAQGELQQARLGTVVAARTALANALDVLGVAAPDSM
ncbi:arginine--tRNA ligase [Salinarchaeum laminariae]|uniref:arginine--tRNA ligase n=1 Tax=Salinarchaeum laminariae TaxID=869888 RepID=UPI0020BEB2C9|nr:arginine--tRNA ligase [Salinarchaeum laminariae]